MVDITIFIKQLIIRFLPEPFLKLMKKYHYARVLKHTTINDEIDLKVVKDLIEVNDYVLDIGVYTKFLSNWVGQRGIVYSFEPVPPTFEVLKSNISSLGLSNVELLELAISDSVGVATMKVPDFESGGKNYYQARISSEGSKHKSESYTVRTTTVDDICSTLTQKISFIKCDVEGHELSCVKGALHTIQSSRPSWLIEVSIRPDDPDCRGNVLCRLLAQHGYAAYWFDGSKLIEYSSGDTSVNYFFLTHEQRARVTGLI